MAKCAIKKFIFVTSSATAQVIRWYTLHRGTKLQAVEKANSPTAEVMGSANFDHRCSKTTERILMKPRIYNYVAGSLWPHIQMYVALRQPGWSRRPHDMSYVFVSLLTFFLYSWHRATPSPVGRFWRFMRNDVFPRQDVPFASPVVAFPILGIKFPPPKKLFFGRG